MWLRIEMVSSSLQGFCFRNIKSSIWFIPKVLINEFDLNYIILNMILKIGLD